jgi:hypothetical protein
MRVACIWFNQAAPTTKIAELFLRFSPQICVRKDRAIFIEIGKCSGLYSELSFLARAQILLRRSGHSAQIKIANDITDSLTLAKYQCQRVEDLPLPALIEFSDPFDRDLVLQKSILNFLSSFQDLGIKTLGQFKKIPASDLIARFGVIGRHCHSRTHFLEPIQWPLWKPEEVILERKEFPYFEFYGELDPILFELKAQLDQIFARLFSRGKRATRLQVEIQCEKVSIHPHFIRSFDFDFFTPQSKTKGTLRIFKERLTKEFEKHPILSPIEAIQTKVLKIVDASPGQKNIFNADEEKLEALYSVHNQLVEMLGRENVYQATLTEDRRPERSWKKQHGSPHELGEHSVDLASTIPDRPTYLCRRPVKIQLTAGYIHIHQRRYRILNWDNQVEKITGGWFEKPSSEIENTFDRNYFTVELEGHQRITVFETPTREFFLHGYYG